MSGATNYKSHSWPLLFLDQSQGMPPAPATDGLFSTREAEIGERRRGRPSISGSSSVLNVGFNCQGGHFRSVYQLSLFSFILPRMGCFDSPLHCRSFPSWPAEFEPRNFPAVLWHMRCTNALTIQLSLSSIGPAILWHLCQ